MNNNIDDVNVRQIITQTDDLLSILMGKHPDDAPFDATVKTWSVSSEYISNIYRLIINMRRA